MTQIRYVRIQAEGRTGSPIRGIQSFRVMPARLPLLLSLLLPALIGQAQPFLNGSCVAECQPALDAMPTDTVLDCAAALPAFAAPTGTACATAPIENNPSVELDATSFTRHNVETAFGDGDDWALWLGSFDAMGFGASEHFIPTADGVYFEQYANGTARFTGEVKNDLDPDQRFELDIFLQGKQDYDGWTALGRLAKDDLALGAYVDWSFYEMVDTLSRLIGHGDYEGDMLYLDHMPTSRLFGFQVGLDGANNRNTNHGVSGWFWYRGSIGGNPVLGTGDVNADLTNEETLGVTCPIVGEYQRYSMVWSTCGHDLHAQTIETIDTVAPIPTELPPLEAVDCTQLPDTPGVEAFTILDACSGEFTAVVASDVVTGPPCDQILTRTWTIADACGNSMDTLQTVALIDTTGPEFTVMDTTIVCDDWDSFVPPAIEVTDNCSPGDSVTFAFTDTVTDGFFPFQFTLDRIYTATDLCGNSTVDTMTISVIDTVAPTWVFLPPDTTILCDQWEDYTIIQPIVEDNCDPAPEGPGGGGATDTTITEGECFGEFLVELTFEFSDMSGNTISYVQVINAVDTIPPTFPYFPPDTVLDCSEAYPDPADDAIWMATAEDNFCPFDVTWADSLVAGECLGNDTLFRTFTAIDDCENTTTMVQTLVRQDTLAPMFAFPPTDTTIACGADLPELDLTAVDNCSGVDSVWVVDEDLPIEFGQAVSADFESCDLDGFVAEGGTISISNDAFDGSCAVSMLHAAGDPEHNFYPADILAGRGVYTVMARADGFISDNLVQILGGDDAGSPAITVSLRPDGTDNPGIEVSGFGLDADATPTMTEGEWYAVRIELGADLLTLSIDDVEVLSVDLPADLPEQGRFKLATAFAGSYDNMAYQPEDPCPVVARIQRTLHAQDGCGLIGTAVQIVDVIDTVAPVFLTFPMDTTIACDAEWPMPEDGASLMATAEDACDDWTVSWSDQIVEGACLGVDTLKRTFTATDACGNQVSQLQTLSKVDEVGPALDEATLPADTTVNCDAVPAPLDSTAFGVTDNCSTWTFAVEVQFGVLPPDGCQFPRTDTHTYTFTDCSGNATVFVHTLTVQDTTPPVFLSLPPDSTLDCAVPWPAPTDDMLWMPTAEDNCSDLEITWSDEEVAGECVGNDTLFRTFTAMDECGNASFHVQILAHIDTTAPVIDEASVPEAVTIQCMDLLPVDVPTATDACSDPFLVVSEDTTAGPGLCEGGIEVTRTFTFSDACGNLSVATQLVTVVDTVAPEFDEASLPIDETLYCEEVMPTCADYDVLAFDTCCETEVTCEEDVEETACPGTYTLFLNYTATDENGNAAYHTTTYSVVDTVGPVLDSLLLPNDTIINCEVASIDLTPTLDSAAFGAVDGCNGWTFAVETVVEGEAESPCDYTRFDIYTFTDCDGNVTEFTHVLAVQDTTGPMIDGGIEGITYACPQEVPEFDTSLPLSQWDGGPDISDFCTPVDEITATYEDVVTVNVDPTHYTMVRMWTFVDQCGNPTFSEQEIVVDEPELALPNAFSPGNNNYNDLYVIPNMYTEDTDEGQVPPCYWGGDNRTIHFQVFNRWGTRVYFQEGPYTNDWDGRSDTDDVLPDGTYFVLLTTEFKNYGVYVDLRNDSDQ